MKRGHRDTIHHAGCFCPSPDGPQMSRNLSTFAARGLFQGTDAHGRWLADGPAEASWLVQNWGRYSHHKLACVFFFFFLNTGKNLNINTKI